MKLITSIFALGVSVVIAALGAGLKQTITHGMTLNAIMTFRVEDAREAGAVVMQFVDQSHDVIVKISPKTLPFLSNKSLPEKYRAILLAAFVIGNVDSQLLRQQKKDDSYAGLLQLIESYRQMQRKTPKLRIGKVGKFIEMQNRGELKAYVSR